MGQTIPIPVLRQRGSSRIPLESIGSPARSLYIHVPFCHHKCHYCDFYSIVDTRDRQGPFTERLIREIRTVAAQNARAGAAPLETIFVGGGTPSLLAPALWRRLLEALSEAFDLSLMGEGAGEFTVECNPETVSPELMETLKDGGVNRVSVGAQSFNTKHLKTLERWHDPRRVSEALSMAADAGIERRSLDLIYGVPGQTCDEWRADLETGLAADSGLEHISCYALTYEPNTAMTRRMERGEFDPAEDEVELEMQKAVEEILGAAGLHRYEISNYARGADGRSLHNLAYWRNQQWLAAGPSASGHVTTGKGGYRWKNVPRLDEWMRGVEDSGGYSPTVDLEAPDPRRAVQDGLMMGLRLVDGINVSPLLAMARLVGADVALREAAQGATQAGRLVIEGEVWRPTEEGLTFANTLALNLMMSVERAE